MSKQKNQHNQSSYELAITHQKLTSRGGLLALIKVLEHFNLSHKQTRCLRHQVAIVATAMATF